MDEEILLEAVLNSNFNIDDGDGEDDITDQQNRTYDITWYGASLDVEGLVRRFDSKRIYLPNYQRSFVWNRKQASRLIESILIGLPIPSLFLYKGNNREESVIIDGLQRLTTLSAFKNDCWPTDDSSAPDESSPRRSFKLIGLPENSRFTRKSYSELDEQDQEKLNNTLIQVLFIEQRSPDDEHSSAFHLFERLNSGGTPLQAQEMRNALYGGSFREHLYTLTQTEIWQKVFGGTHKRAKDQELILRFLALLERCDEYRPPMKLFLNKFMCDHKDADEETLAKFSTQFTQTLERIYTALGDEAFRSRKHSRALSASYFDAFMVAVAQDEDVQSESIISAHNSLRKNSEFLDFTRVSTTASIAVKARIEMVKEAINVK